MSKGPNTKPEPELYETTPKKHPNLRPELEANLWKPGQSGNPKGRPKGAQHTKLLFLRVVLESKGHDLVGLAWKTVGEIKNPRDKMIAILELMKYAYPQLKVHEVNMVATAPKPDYSNVPRQQLYDALIVNGD